MDSSELIELFYNRTYEKFVNKQILDDKNFIVPRQQLINYVYELVNIPLIDFIDYIKHNEIDRRLELADITQFSSFSTCEIEMCKALLWANNPGCKYVDIGRFFPNKLISRSESAYWRYGELHIKASTQLGLTFEYYNYWYLSCLGYIYPELEKNLRIQLLARTITRNRLYQQLLIDILDHDVNPEVYINKFPNYNFKRCLRSVYFFLNICLDICRKEGIKAHNIIKGYEPSHDIIQDEKSLETNERIDKFIIEIGREPFLSAYEEIELAQKIRKGEIDARKKLVSANLRFVIRIAKQYLHKGLEFEDLLQEGFLGLIKASELYDETRGFKFISFALWWIKRYLSNAIFTDSTLIRFPLNARILHKRVKDFKAKYEHQYGFMPPVTEIEIDDENNHEIISYLYRLPNNLKDTCVSYEDLDVFEDSHNDIWDYEDNDYNKEYVKTLLSHLSQREQNILRKFYGIDVREETLESISEYYGLTRERARQIKEKAIVKLREGLQSSNNKEQVDHKDEEPKEKELTIGETERKKRIQKILIRAEKNKKDSSNHNQREQYRIINNDKTFEIHGKYNTLLFRSKGYARQLNGILYCFRSEYTCLYIFDINMRGREVRVGEMLVRAHRNSDLYQLLIGKEYDKIEGIIRNGSSNECKVFADGNWYNNSGILVKDKGEKTTKESDYLPRSEKDQVLHEVEELDGVNVGDQMEYNGKKCTICKIYVRKNSSKFLVKYDNEVLDYVPNKKTLYRKALTQNQSLNSETKVRVKKLHEIKEAMVGDRILYDKKRCTVIEKKTIKGSLRLVVKYEDGTFDNLKNDWNRYRII